MEKQLRRSRSNRVIAGVCGGIGQYLGADPVAIRLAVILLMFLAGMPLVVYLIMWLIIPEEDSYIIK
ncbi:MAG: PspC domain-containing protein [Alistipes sp.]|nr:PspC domain-containing protein [Alistipes sp.]